MPPAIASEKYVRLTTFTKDGRRKHTPVWIAELSDGKIGFTTSAHSWKVKRIRNTPKVELSPSDVRGNVAEGAPVLTGVAEIALGDDLAPVRKAIQSKYGIQMTLISMAGKVGRIFGRKNDHCGIVITLD